MIPINLDSVRHIRLTPNALADAETAAGMGIVAMVDLNTIGFRSIRALLWAGLKWEDHSLTLEKTGDLMAGWQKEGHSFDELATILIKALDESGWFPEISRAMAGGEKNGES